MRNWLSAACIAVAASLALAVSAHAVATYYVAPSGSASWGSAVNRSTPASLATANANATFGDTVQLLGSGTSYSTAIAPNANGVRFIGNVTRPDSVVVTGKLTLSRDDMTVRGVSFTGGCDFTGGADRDSVVWCRFNGTQELFIDRSEYNVFANNVFVGTQIRFGWTQVSDDPGGWPVVERVKYAKILDNTMTLTLPSGTSEDVFRMRGAVGCEVARNAVTWTIPTICDGGTHGTMLYHALNNYFHDNYWLVKSNAPGRRYALHLRDSTRFNTFVRDTIVEDLTGSGSTGLVWTGSGNNSTMLTLRSNTLRACVVKVKDEGLSWGNFSRGDSIVGNTFISVNGNAMMLAQDVPPDSVVMEHNAFISPTALTLKGSARFEGLNYALRGWKVKSNIFYMGRTSTTLGQYAVAAYFGQDNNSTHAFDDATTTDDYNLYWSGSGGSEPRQNQSIGYGALTYKTPAGFAASFGGREANSRAASPRWADSTFTITRGGANGFALLPGSNALFGPDGYVGPFGSSVDTCLDSGRPGRITNLALAGVTQSSITLQWTQTGSDQYATNDGQTQAFVRVSTAPITTEAEWSAATLCYSAELIDPNTPTSATVISGLPTGATRWFAARYVDGDGLAGCLSASVSGTTADNTVPATVSDLSVLTTTASTATLRWTAPGDDGATGTATSYAVRYRTNSPIVSDADWAASTSASGVPTPSVAGSVEGMVVTGLLSDRTYYFALRATDDVGNTSGTSNSPFGITPDVTAPGQVTTLSAPSATATSVTLRWTAVGDDGSTGTASQNLIRYTTSAPITNETAWASASAMASPPAPQVAGTVQSATVSGLLSGTTYYFAMRSIDESGNVGAISNTVSRSTIAVDATRPAPPAITAKAWPGVLDGVLVIFSAVGDDSLTGTASSYTLRYRLDPGLSAATWDTQGATSWTYRWPTTQAPKAAGQADTVYVRDLRPGRSYWFGLIATDDTGLPSALSNVDSVTTPDAPGSDYVMPAPFTYGGAGPGSRPAWFPYVGLDGAAVDTAVCRQAANRVAVSFCPEFADSAGKFGKYVSLAALKSIRAANPAIKLMAEPPAAAVYYRASVDSLNTYNWYQHAWAAARDSGGGWTPGTGAPGGAWTPGAYTDSTGSKGFLWSDVPGYRGWFFMTVEAGYTGGATAAGIAGNTTWNLNLAYQPTPGRFPVARALAEQVINEIVLRKHPDGSWVWDGCRWDLFIQNPSGFAALSHDSIDYVRAGYPTKMAFDTAWVAASQYAVNLVRRAANDAGRPDFILSGNGGSGVAYDASNGFMREAFPSQQGGSWWTNVFWFPGGLANDAERYAYKPRDNAVFTFKCANDSCPSPPDTAASVRKDVRYGLGTATLYGGTFFYGSQYASEPKGGGQGRVHYDEYAVDTMTSVSQQRPWLMGWLGTPQDRPWMNALPIASVDQLQGSGGFEGTQINKWTRTSSGSVSITAVTDTVRTGTYSLRARIASPQSIDYAAIARGDIKFYGTSGDSVTLTFWARSDIARPIQVGVYGYTSGAMRSDWSTNCRQWVYPGAWRPYRLSGVLTTAASESVSVAFWFGDTTGTVWIDDVSVTKGRARGGSLVREFRRGAVVVNPYGRPDTVTFGRMVRRITAYAGNTAAPNNGELVAAGSPIVIPANDARFLLFPPDSLRPKRVTDLIANTPTSSSCRVAWTAPGDDSLTGTPTAVYLRLASTPIVTENDWTAATPVTVSTPAGGTAFSVTVTGLTASTVYYFAMRATDKAGYTATISNSDSVTTLAAGVAPSAAFAISPASGAEPLSITCTDQSTGGPTAWEWYVRRTTPAGDGDPQISSAQSPTFSLVLGGTYTVSLQASNDYGSDTTLTTVVVSCTAPSPITSLSASASTGTSVSVAYVESGDDGDAGTAASFELRYVKGSTFTTGDWNAATVVAGLPTPEGSGVPHTVEVLGLDPGQSYAFAMKATDSGGCQSAIGTVAVASTVGALEKSIGVSFGTRDVILKIGGKP